MMHLQNKSNIVFRCQKTRDFSPSIETAPCWRTAWHHVKTLHTLLLGCLAVSLSLAALAASNTSWMRTLASSSSMSSSSSDFLRTREVGENEWWNFKLNSVMDAPFLFKTKSIPHYFSNIIFSSSFHCQKARNFSPSYCVTSIWLIRFGWGGGGG